LDEGAPARAARAAPSQAAEIPERSLIAAADTLGVRCRRGVVAAGVIAGAHRAGYKAGVSRS